MDDRTSHPVPKRLRSRRSGRPSPPERRLVALSPINRRRWQNFKANRRGFWSLWVFLVLFFLSLSPNSSPTTSRS